jgi:acetate kinase
MPDAILTLNAGSSSLKFALFWRAGKKFLSGAVEGIGTTPHFFVRDADGKPLHDQKFADGLDHEQLLSPLLAWIDSHLGDEKLIAAGHRIVHGGTKFAAPVQLNDAVLADLAELNDLAPLHEPHNLAAIRAVMALRPSLVQIGCFDTAFHRTLQPEVTRLPLPRHYFDEGVRRYGFHGLSYEYISERLHQDAPTLAAGRVIAAHLGNGASACAMINGKSVESTMGFTGLDGLIMGTRTGIIDAGAVLYLMQSRQMDAAALTDLLYKKSGLLGLSGISSDMRALLASPEPAAAQAVAAFCYAAAKQMAGLVVAMGGLDGLIFTAGIGEHCPPIRATICAHLKHLGITIDDSANTRNAPIISPPASQIAVHVIPTNEEGTIARHCEELLALAEKKNHDLSPSWRALAKQSVFQTPIAAKTS